MGFILGKCSDFGTFVPQLSKQIGQVEWTIRTLCPDHTVCVLGPKFCTISRSTVFSPDSFSSALQCCYHSDGEGAENRASWLLYSRVLYCVEEKSKTGRRWEGEDENRQKVRVSVRWDIVVALTWPWIWSQSSITNGLISCDFCRPYHGLRLKGLGLVKVFFSLSINFYQFLCGTIQQKVSLAERCPRERQLSSWELKFPKNLWRTIQS